MVEKIESRLSFSRISTLRILPLMVFGSVFTNSIWRGYLYGAVLVLTKFWISFTNSSPADLRHSFASTIVALTIIPLTSSGTPVTAHSTTAGCFMSTLSTSKGLIL